MPPGAAVDTVLFDLDETLILDEPTTAALASVAAVAAHRCALDPMQLARDVRRCAGELWRAASTIEACRAIGVSSAAALWGGFTADDAHSRTLRAWVPGYRVDAWSAALQAQGVDDGALAAELAESFMAARRRHVPFPDALPALTGLARAGCRLGVVTNGASDLQREKLDGSGLAGFFGAVMVGGDVGDGKPGRRIFRAALERLGAPPETTAMVGDKLDRDVLGARRCGIRAIWLNRTAQPASAEIVPDAEISSLEHLEDAL